MQEFINELSNYLKGNFEITKEEKTIIQDFLANNNLTISSRNSIIKNERDIVLNYGNNNFKDETMYFVKDNKKPYWRNNQKEYDNESFAVLKVQDGKIEEIGIPKKEVPEDIGVNKVFTVENSKYVVQNIATSELQETLTNMVEEIIEKQNVTLRENRKEGHLYLVTEELGDSRLLWDLTDKPRSDFEEVDIPENLLDKSTEGIVLKYINGQYEYYSDDGFDRII